ncbi:thioredoxin domain-containing protein [Aurantiacibacter sp. D1-12]|uniref:thioredoxin domain-containing protein n=1 Tax=Aurantiacibacter sp. D1-12 TaxID=2993658 RepID=UPI00237D220B|nr:thioredoxin domain-containing protein [Aurantiacibacter sp. D1-12]MDE1467896.1 thioredoxin domain-containing protein [Aurantiacibacter sp. D1-12]
MNASRRITLALFAAPLALAISACSGGAADGEIAEGEALDPIAAPEGGSWLDVVTQTEEYGYVLGNPDAPIKLIEYGSFTCGTCARFTMEGSEPLKQDYVSTGLVSYELRNLDRNGVDTVISAITRCTAPEAFHPLADQVWLNFETVMQGVQSADLGASASLPQEQQWVYVAQESGLLDFFAARGISRDQAASCLSDYDAVLNFSNATNAIANEMGATGTPSFYVNGSKVDGVSWLDLEPILRRAGAREE